MDLSIRAEEVDADSEKNPTKLEINWDNMRIGVAAVAVYRPREIHIATHVFMWWLVIKTVTGHHSSTGTALEKTRYMYVTARTTTGLGQFGGISKLQKEVKRIKAE